MYTNKKIKYIKSHISSTKTSVTVKLAHYLVVAIIGRGIMGRGRV